MEFLRRLRIIWTALCIIAAVLVVIAHFGNPRHISLFLAVPCLVAAISFRIDGPLTTKLSVLWFGGPVLGAVIAVATSPYKSNDGPAVIGALVAMWVAAAVLTWLIGGLRKPKNTS